MFTQWLLAPQMIPGENPRRAVGMATANFSRPFMVARAKRRGGRSSGAGREGIETRPLPSPFPAFCREASALTTFIFSTIRSQAIQMAEARMAEEMRG